MVKGKYLTISLIILLNTICCSSSYAGAYLPEPGHYKYSMSYSSLDTISKKKRNQRASIFTKIQDVIREFSADREEIIQIANEQNRVMTTVEMEEVDSLGFDIEELKEEAKSMASFSDDIMSCMEIEYGITESQSFGLKIDYTMDKFAEIQNEELHRTTHVGKDIESFYKYKLFQNDKIIATLQPKLHYSIYNDVPSYKVDMGLFIGHSHEGKKHTSFQEIGIVARKYFEKGVKTPVGFVISFLEGFKLKNGLIISNYNEYEKKKSTNFLYKATIYEQISFAKEFSFASVNTQSFTAQIGYFWKGSAANPVYTISGPIFSLWCDL